MVTEPIWKLYNMGIKVRYWAGFTTLQVVDLSTLEFGGSCFCTLYVSGQLVSDLDPIDSLSQIWSEL